MGKFVFLFLSVFLATTILANPNEQNVLKEINRINRAQNLWRAGKTPLSGLNEHQMRRYLGARKMGKNVKRRHIQVPNGLPDSFDSRQQWPDCPSIDSIKDQGDCGSCWAVSTASAASDRLCIGSQFAITLNLSAENLMACCSNCAPDGGCNGGWPHLAWDYIENTGIVTGGDYDSNEGCQPYDIVPTGISLKRSRRNETPLPTPPCEDTCTNPDYNTDYDDDFHYGDSSYTVAKDPAQIQSDIYNNGPNVACFDVYSDFQNYQNGVYIRSSDKYLGSHAVRLLGWGTDEDSGVDYWLVANSWNRTWGENGLFRIRRGTDECGIEDEVAAGTISS